jgi:DNA-binding PadR family transcriptional regulator
MAAPLGATQEAMLEVLELHGGFWHVGCGWLMGSPSQTTRILDSLAARGLVETRPYYRDSKLYRLVKSS